MIFEETSSWNTEQSSELLLLSRSNPSLTSNKALRFGLHWAQLRFYIVGGIQGTHVEKFPDKIIFPASASAGRLNA